MTDAQPTAQVSALSEDEIVEAMERAGCEAANEAYDTGGAPTPATRLIAGKIFMHAALAVARQHIEAADREKVATWIIKHGFATGHGDTIDDLLAELSASIIGLSGKDYRYD